MGDLAAEGGKIFWVAPSGGRDRPDPETGKFVVAPFDSKALDMFKLIAIQSHKVREGVCLDLSSLRCSHHRLLLGWY
jgi:hypothetical protein